MGKNTGKYLVTIVIQGKMMESQPGKASSYQMLFEVFPDNF